MVEIGGMPILWHIMKLYSHHGVNDFIICCGYKGYTIKEHERRAEPWRITLVDTGDSSMTGGRILRVADHLRGEDAFCLTYGDGVGDIDITGSIAFHRVHGRDATMTATRPPARFGAV